MDQLWRATSSIAANIAEGATQDTHAQFGRYLGIALGSAAEVESHLLLAIEVGVISAATGEPMLREIDEIKRMLWTLRERVRCDPRRRNTRGEPS